MTRERTATALSRRSLFLGASAMVATAALPGVSWAGRARDFHLRMYCGHTGEHFRELVVANREWNPDALEAFSRFARDWREDAVRPIHPNTILIAVKLQALLETTTPMTLLSGYRTPQTNGRLREAASSSLHMRALALDLYQPDRTVRDLHMAARATGGGGVGYYPNKNFVHVDCGRPRSWTG